MCGRYLFTEEGSEILSALAAIIDQNYGAAAWHRGEIAPSSAAPVLVFQERAVKPVLQQWGFRIPQRLIINARGETASEKPLFRDSLAQRRCVLPCSGFFEWDGEKRKYLFTSPSAPELYLAGIWEKRNGKDCFCILTTEANDSMKPVHSRMPVVLPQNMVRTWLEEESAAGPILNRVPDPLQRDCQDDQFSLW